MLIHLDVKSLELVTAAYLSRDEVLIAEITQGVDIHQNNKERFKLPERRIAKIFVFRLIYGGQAYSYAHDTDFNYISKSIDHWQQIIDDFYKKYPQIAKWHENLVSKVLDTGQLVIPTRRVYSFPRDEVAANLWFWRPKILNYPVQGLGADLVAIGRVSLWRRLQKSGLRNKVLFISTVHDSIDLDVLDTSMDLVYNVCRIAKESIMDIPRNFERLFKVPFDLPVGSEIGYGPSLGELKIYNNE